MRFTSRNNIADYYCSQEFITCHPLRHPDIGSVDACRGARVCSRRFAL